MAERGRVTFAELLAAFWASPKGDRDAFVAALRVQLAAERAENGKLTPGAIRMRLRRMKEQGATEEQIAVEREKLRAHEERTEGARVRARDAARDAHVPGTYAARDAHRAPLARALSDQNPSDSSLSSSSSSPSSQQPLLLGEGDEPHAAGARDGARDGTRALVRAASVRPVSSSFTVQVFTRWQEAYVRRAGPKVEAPDRSAGAMKGAKVVADWILRQATQEGREPADVLDRWLERLFASENPWHAQVDFALHKVCSEVAGIYRGSAGRRGAAPRPIAPHAAFGDPHAPVTDEEIEDVFAEGHG